MEKSLAWFGGGLSSVIAVAPKKTHRVSSRPHLTIEFDSTTTFPASSLHIRTTMAEQKKKRAYAAQAYDFGANSVGSAPPPPYNTGMGAPMQQGIPQQGFAPQQGFVSQGAPQQGFQPGIQPQSPIDPLAQGFGQMNLGGQPQQVTPQAQAPGHVNPLLTTDLVTQPFHVLELEVCWVCDF
jgi:hypothetical protein